MIEPGPVGGTAPGASWLNKLRGFVLSLRILDGYGYKVRRGPNGTMLEIEPSKGGGGKARAYKLLRVEPDYLVCYPKDYVVTGNATTDAAAEVKIAKDESHRESVTTQSLFGTTYTYTYADSTYTQNRKRTSHAPSGGDEVQYISPPWEVGGIIYAESVNSTGVTVNSAELTLIDCNRSGRAWMKI